MTPTRPSVGDNKSVSSPVPSPGALELGERFPWEAIAASTFDTKSALGSEAPGHEQTWCLSCTGLNVNIREQ